MGLHAMAHSAAACNTMHVVPPSPNKMRFSIFEKYTAIPSNDVAIGLWRNYGAIGGVALPLGKLQRGGWPGWGSEFGGYI